MRRDSANTNAEFSLVVQPWAVLRSEDCLLTYIVVYKFDVIFYSNLTLWNYNSPFCISSSKKYCTKIQKFFDFYILYIYIYIYIYIHIYIYIQIYQEMS